MPSGKGPSPGSTGGLSSDGRNHILGGSSLSTLGAEGEIEQVVFAPHNSDYAGYLRAGVYNVEEERQEYGREVRVANPGNTNSAYSDAALTESGDKVVFSPYRADDRSDVGGIAIYDVKTGTFDYLNGGDSLFDIAVLAGNGDILMAGDSGSGIVKTPDSPGSTGFSYKRGPSIGVDDKANSGVMAPNGDLLITNQSDNEIYRYDPDKESVVNSYSIGANVTLQINGPAARVGDKVVFAGGQKSLHNGEFQGDFYVFDTQTESVTYGRSDNTIGVYFGAIAADTGEVILIPRRLNSPIGVIDPEEITYDAIAHDSRSDEDVDTEAQNLAGIYRGAVKLSDGRIIMTPGLSLGVGVFDPSDRSFEYKQVLEAGSGTVASGNTKMPGERFFSGAAVTTVKMDSRKQDYISDGDRRFNFETGDLSNWDVVNDLETDSARSFNGSWSGKVDGTPDVVARTVPAGYGNGARPETIEFYAYETSASTGGGIRFNNSDDSMEFGIALDGPDWILGYRDTYATRIQEGDGVDRWIRFRVDIDWTNKTLTTDFEDLQSGLTHQSQYRLLQGIDIKEIIIDNYSGGISGDWSFTSGGSDMVMWFDDITLTDEQDSTVPLTGSDEPTSGTSSGSVTTLGVEESRDKTFTAQTETIQDFEDGTTDDWTAGNEVSDQDRHLSHGVDIEKIRITEYGGGTWDDDSAMEMWFDDITLGFDSSSDIVYDFETGDMTNWDTVNHMSADQTRVLNGSWSGYVNVGSGVATSIIAEDTPTGFSGGDQPDSFTFYWNETSAGSGGGIELINSSGNRELGLASDNPEWEVTDSDGVEQLGSTDVQSNESYGRWVKYHVTFDWANGEYDIDMELANKQITASNSRSFTGSWSGRIDSDVYMLAKNVPSGYEGGERPGKVEYWWYIETGTNGFGVELISPDDSYILKTVYWPDAGFNGEDFFRIIGVNNPEDDIELANPEGRWYKITIDNFDWKPYNPDVEWKPGKTTCTVTLEDTQSGDTWVRNDIGVDGKEFGYIRLTSFDDSLTGTIANIDDLTVSPPSE